MVRIVVVTRAALLIARRASTWTVAEHLNGRSPVCVAVDTRDPTRVYCGTAGAGLFRSRDSGRNWEPVGPGIDHPIVTAVAVGNGEQADGLGIVYAGTEPSAVFRSDTGGDSLAGPRRLAALPSADTWIFPTAPHASCSVDRSRCECRGSRVRRNRGWGARDARSTAGGPGVIAFAVVPTTRTRRRRTRLHPGGSTRPPATGTSRAPMPGTRGDRLRMD